MNIIVVGCGKVGYLIASQLSAENHHVTVIDKRDAALRRADEALHVLSVKGSGASIETLHSAGISDSEMLIAVTGEDELNIICCLMAKTLGVKYTVARIRDPEYSREASLLQEQIGLGRIINPELTAAREISRLIRFPDAVHVDAFAQGKAEMVGFKVHEQDGISGVPLSQLSAKLPKNLLFCAIERGETFIIPRGDSSLENGDVAYIMAERTNSSKFFRMLGRKKMRAKDVMIAGGGRLAVYLARRLDSVGIRVIIIEQNEDKCRSLSELLPFATIVNGDGTDIDTMHEENVAGMDYFVAVTDRDEENIFAAINAKKGGAKRAVVKINKGNFASVMPSLGLECVITPKELVVSYIIRYVRGLVNSEGSEILTLYKVMGGQAETMEFLVRENADFIGVPLKQVKFKRDLLLCAIVRDGELIIPGGDDCVMLGDHIIIIAAGLIVKDINDILEK